LSVYYSIECYLEIELGFLFGLVGGFGVAMIDADK